MLHSLVRLPHKRRPAKWDKIDDPVYGHPWAGFGIANWNDDYFLKIVRKITSWECLFSTDGNIMWGREESLVPMWARLRKKIYIKNPTPRVDEQYLGCTQRVATL